MKCDQLIVKSIFLIWFEECVIANGGDYGNKIPKFAITDTKVYVPVVALSAQDNEKPMQLKKIVLKEQLTGININHNQKYRH